MCEPPSFPPPAYEDSSPPPSAPVDESTQVAVPIEAPPNDRYPGVCKPDTDVRTAIFNFMLWNWFFTTPIMYVARIYGIFAIPFNYNVFVTAAVTYQHPDCLKLLMRFANTFQVILWTAGPVYFLFYIITYKSSSVLEFITVFCAIVYFLVASATMHHQEALAKQVRALVQAEKKKKMNTNQA
ncbi:Protein CBG25889 [Caenorhabditis briggsae]|uniref:Uncharacterized protein n=2 Tax=Caenorhabditis briggsae TaxID=6238 RepID=A0AAE9JC59_CAEBR|nr:Protein CBG25889 [Caenorhabditis briggsae]ULU01715.1 hypothetical protein L3Y34_001777 [Caenorhabditis briggsae]UMM24349.1 hypothetical protein L5515_004618 [Caenorhabditis briggsae]CAR99400.1 Protein CBG25889 [Caenorhabditis briggsae]